MASLFERDQSVVARHIGNVFREGELSREGSMQILHRTPSGKDLVIRLVLNLLAEDRP
jgi:hypothetical protein